MSAARLLGRAPEIGCVIAGPHSHDGGQSCGARGVETLASCLACRRVLLTSQVPLHGWWEHGCLWTAECSGWWE